MNKRTLATLGASAALTLGVIGTVARAETPPPSPSPATSPPAPKTGTTGASLTQEPSYTSSVRVTESTATEDNQAAESAALAALAKISDADARNAALAKFPGATIDKTSLEDENGNVVWAIQLTDANKAAQEVKVDAGNGGVLAAEAGGADHEKSPDKD